MSMNSVTSGVSTQVSVISNIPGRVMQMWPGIITFAVVEQAMRAVLGALPSTGGGIVGMAGESLIRGTAQLTNFVTFQAIQGVFGSA